MTFTSWEDVVSPDFPRELTPEQLRSLLALRPVTQGRYAEAVGISRQTLTRYLSGELAVPVHVVLALRFAVVYPDVCFPDMFTADAA
jgi:hypothetical protein